MPLWACRLEMLGLVDLRELDQQREYDLDYQRLISDDWSFCQAAASKLRRLSKGVLSPSAALEGHTNVTLFGPLRAIDWRRGPSLASTVPATIVAIGRPRSGLLQHVRRPDAPPAQAPLF